MSTSTINAFLGRATSSPYALSLGVGLGSISYFFWGNLAMQSMGGIALSIYPEERKKLGIDTSKAVEIWSWGYVRGAKHLGVSSAVTSLALLAAAFQIPSQQSPSLQNYLLFLSPLCLSIGLYTFAFMMPTNKAILAIRDKITKAHSTSNSQPALTSAQESEAETLLQKWKQLHYVRLGLGALGWVGTLAAYTLTV